MQALTTEARKLRRHTQRLTIDTLVVLTGLRPAAMLDYAPSCSPKALAQMCGRISTQHRIGAEHGASPRPGAAGQITALSWQGSLWILNCEALQRRIYRVLHEGDVAVPELRIVTFRGDGREGPVRLLPAGRHTVRVDPMCTVAGRYSCSALCTYLQHCIKCGSILQWIHDAAALLQEARDHLEDLARLLSQRDKELARGKAQCSSVWILPDDAAIGSLPSVNGLLLGYPWTYWVDARNVNAASRQLSATPLLLCRCANLLLAFLPTIIVLALDGMSCGPQVRKASRIDRTHLQLRHRSCHPTFSIGLQLIASLACLTCEPRDRAG